MSKGYDYPLELEFTEQEEQYFSSLDKKEDPIQAEHIMSWLETEFGNRDIKKCKSMKSFLIEIGQEISYNMEDELQTVLTEELGFEELVQLKLKIERRATFRKQYEQYLATFELEQGEAPYDLF